VYENDSWHLMSDMNQLYEGENFNSILTPNLFLTWLFNPLSMKGEKSHSGFNPKRIFTNHMASIGYASVFNRIE
jgi:hypothetical protein